MNPSDHLPRILIIDDLFGRTNADCLNAERASLCGQYLLRDITGDESSFSTRLRVRHPVAEAVFCRGQRPACAKIGDVVENDLESTIEIVRAGWFGQDSQSQHWALVLLDLCFYTGAVTEKSSTVMLGMPEGRSDDDDPNRYFGLTLLSELMSRFPDLPVVILSSQAREEVSREFAARGALAFISRADANGGSLVADYIRRYGLIPDDQGEIIGDSKLLLLCLREARHAAAARRNVLIRGERGSGKELLARYIHRHSLGKETTPYVIVDSGALSPQLYGSELFGHKRGAFTGADRDREGKIVQASGGDIFLDEIGNMPLEVQIGLLRVLEQREVAPLGSQRGQKVDVRFLCATNEDLEAATIAGTFRADLLDRLREGGVINVPPLRERLTDILLLAEHVVRAAEASNPDTVRRRIEEETIEFLKTYTWPGNIREFGTAINGAVLRYPNVEHMFPMHLRLGAETRAAASPDHDLVRTAATDSQPLAELLNAIDAFPAKTLGPSDFVGTLERVELATAQLKANLLKAALHATRRPTPNNPEGAILIHPALKLLTGDKSVTASKAADLVKRIVNASEALKPRLLEDPVLREAFYIAERLRPGTRPTKF